MGLQYMFEESMTDEDAVQIELKSFLEKSGLWNVYREVDGKLLYRHPSKNEGSVRIDFIISPKDSAIKQGWSQGLIGIEVKLPSVAKKGVSQMLDYRNSCFEIRPGFNVIPQTIAIYPYTAQNEVSSIIVQNGCCVAYMRSNSFLMCQGGTNILSFTEDGKILSCKQLSGNKVGSR